MLDPKNFSPFFKKKKKKDKYITFSKNKMVTTVVLKKNIKIFILQLSYY